jgi:hypothetical protein
MLRRARAITRALRAKGHPIISVDIGASGTSDLKIDPHVEVTVADLEAALWPLAADQMFGGKWPQITSAVRIPHS